jgi:ribosome-associated protein
MSGDSSNEIEVRPSKSQRKRDARVLFELGRDLVTANKKTLQRLPLDPRLREAVEQARSIKSHIAHKRQLQHIAGILRGIDATPIAEALDAIRMEARQLTVRHHRVEAWRDRLLSEGDAALQALLSTHASIESQTIRQLVRNARREAEREKPPTSARKLFRLLRELDTDEPLPPA